MQGIQKDYEWYRFPARKEDGNVYTKIGLRATPEFYIMGDLQYRYVNYSISGTRKYPSLNVSEHFNFFNPKIGFRYHLKKASLYLSYAMANKEPNRTDFEQGSNEGPKHEKLQDIELGMEYKDGKKSFGATVYYMDYKDQLVLTGKLNDVGDAVRINVPDSYRLGLETWAGLEINKWLSLQGNVSVSRNKLKLFTDYIPRYDQNFEFEGYDTVRMKNTDISFSPWLTAFASVLVKPLKNLEFSINQKGVSKQYLDNTTSQNKKLKGYIVQDMQLRYSLSNKLVKTAEIIVQLNNLWNRIYETNGYTYSYFYSASLVKENFYYPMAGTNFMIGLNLHF
jgi:iron complex outermembrane receptor protein